MDQQLAGAGGTLALTTYDSAGAPADVDGTNTPTVVVRNSAGATISTIAGSRSSAGTYACVIPVTYATLDLFTATWTWPSTAFRTTQFEVVGSFLFSDAQLRAFDAELTIASYSTAKVRDVREVIDDRFHKACRVSFTRRGRREYLDGDGTDWIFVTEHRVNSVTSATLDDVALTVSDLEVYPRGKIVRTNGAWTWGNRNVELLYEHGYVQPPGPIQDAALRYARYLLVPGSNKNDERITGIQTEVGFQRVSLPGKDGITGIPDVDAVLVDFGLRASGAFA